MLQKLHKNAKTNYSIRKEIKESNLSVSALAEKFNISWLTAKKWKERMSLEDKSSRPDKIRTTLSEKEEDLILFKAALGRSGPDDWGKHKDDLIDIEGLIGAQNVDWDNLVRRARILGMEARLKEKLSALGSEVKVGF